MLPVCDDTGTYNGPLNLLINASSWPICFTVNLDQTIRNLPHKINITKQKNNISSFKHQQNFKLFWYLFKILSYDLNLHTWYFTFFLLIYSNTHVSYNQECFTSCRALPQKMWPQFVSIPYCVFPRHTGQSISPGLVRTLVVAWTCSRVDRTFSSLSGCIFWAPSLEKYF